MGVGRIGRVHGTGVVDERVGGDVGGNQEGGDAHAQAREVVCGMDAVGEAGEGVVVFWAWDVHGWRNVVGEAAVFVKVDNYQAEGRVLSVID